MSMFLRMVLVWLSLSAVGFAEDRRSNVVFILADDLGWSDTTLYGATRLYETPNIQRLASRGMTFTRAYSASPLCSPTRSAIMTGLSPARTGITTPNCHLPQVVLQASVAKSAPPHTFSIQPTTVTRLKPEYRTLAESLRDAGYATGHFGKWHLGPPPYSPLEHGFDSDLPHHSGPGPAGSYVAPWKFKDFDHDPDHPDQHIEDRMAAEAAEWMERHKDEPFFLNYWMFSVHAPFDAKRALIEKYRMRVDSQDPQHCPTYAAMIESMDDAVGVLLDTLDRLGIADNTIVVFTSDNGGNMYSDVDGTVPTSNHPLRGGKATMFEGGTRVPCSIVWPGVVTAGTRNDAIIQSEDFYPTLLEALGIPPAPGQMFDGVSIVPALRGGRLEREAVFQYFPHAPSVPDWIPPSVSVHCGDWKLVRIFHGGTGGQHRYQLYDLSTDIGEARDVSAEKPELVAELDALIDAFLAKTEAVVPIANPQFDPDKYDPTLEGRGKLRSEPKKPPTVKSNKAGDSIPLLGGWKARGCDVEFKSGVALIARSGDVPFLGFAPGKPGPNTTIRFRMRCDGGAGKVEWIPGKLASGNANVREVEYVSKVGDWVEISSRVPAKQGESGVLRLYFPVQDAPLELDWIELETNGIVKRWDYAEGQ